MSRVNRWPCLKASGHTGVLVLRVTLQTWSFQTMGLSTQGTASCSGVLLSPPQLATLEHQPSSLKP